MRTKTLSSILAVAAASMFSTALMAADSQRAATFESLDKNADQQISKSEAQGNKALADGFASADANGDGYLNKSEYQMSVGASQREPASRTPAESPTS